jgi:hypothetical protein
LGKVTDEYSREHGTKVGRLISRLAGLNGAYLDEDDFFECLETLRCALNEVSFSAGEEE